MNNCIKHILFSTLRENFHLSINPLPLTQNHSHPKITKMCLCYTEPAIDTMKLLAPPGTEFVSLEPPYEIPLVKMFRRMKKPKISTFIVLTSTEMTLTVTNTVQQADMFRSQYTWFFISKVRQIMIEVASVCV